MSPTPSLSVRPFPLHSAALALLVFSLATLPASGQQPLLGQQPQGIGQGNQPGQGQQANVFGGVGNNGFLGGSSGGSAQADFDSLIDLIESTVESDSWMDNGTGDGEIQPFPTGVYVDSGGTLKFKQSSLSIIPPPPAPPETTATGSDGASSAVDAHRESKLRYVSLPRLEAAIWQRQLKHQPLAPAMLTLAGLQRIEYVLLVPETGDFLLAGPAGDWQAQGNGRIVSTRTGSPVVRLDDLLTLWRRRQTFPAKAFGCSIVPRQQALAQTQDYLAASAQEPLEPSERGDWLTGLRDTLGAQDVEFFGMQADSHVAQVLLLADYHMKLVGMGIADGVEGVEDYLSTVKLLPDGTASSMAVLRWWFAMRYLPVEVDELRTTYRLQGQGVKVLSESEMLAARGRRVHTGQSDELNRRFADSFTQHFQELAAKYPIYAELRNVFDVALVLSIIEREGLLDRIGWQGRLFASADALRLPKLAVPTEVQTVINHRVIDRRHIVAGISGGVWLDAAQAASIVQATEQASQRPQSTEAPAATTEGEIVWWWD